MDLAFICDGEDEEDDEMFSVKKSVEENAEIFIKEMDEYSIIMTTSLFTEEASHKINDAYHQRNP